MPDKDARAISDYGRVPLFLLWLQYAVFAIPVLLLYLFLVGILLFSFGVEILRSGAGIFSLEFQDLVDPSSIIPLVFGIVGGLYLFSAFRIFRATLRGYDYLSDVSPFHWRTAAVAVVSVLSSLVVFHFGRWTYPYSMVQDCLWILSIGTVLVPAFLQICFLRRARNRM